MWKNCIAYGFDPLLHLVSYSFIHSFIHSLNKYILMSSCVAGIMLDLRNKTAIRTQSCPLGAHSLVGDTDSYKQNMSWPSTIFKIRASVQRKKWVSGWWLQTALQGDQKSWFWSCLWQLDGPGWGLFFGLSSHFHKMRGLNWIISMVPTPPTSLAFLILETV